MNFLAHGYVCAAAIARCNFDRIGSDVSGALSGDFFAAVTAGSMLPDVWKTPAGGPFAEVLDRGMGELWQGLQLGVTLHHAVDSAFHANREVCDEMGALAKDLQTFGVRRGAARAAAHIGVEFIVDGEVHLLIASKYPDLMQRAWGTLREAAVSVSALDLVTRVDHFATQNHSAVYGYAPGIADRIAQVLQHRPILRLASHEIDLVTASVLRRQSAVAALAPLWLAEMAEVVRPLLLNRFAAVEHHQLGGGVAVDLSAKF